MTTLDGPQMTLDGPKKTLDSPKKTVSHRQSRQARRLPAQARRSLRRVRPPARPTEPERETGRPGARRARLLVAALVMALAGVLAAAGILGQRWYADRQLDAAHRQAVAAARQVTLNFVSINASTVDGDLARIATGATGEFKDEFTRGMAQVRAAVVENNVESRGSVLRAGLVSGDLDSAVVLVAIDATVKNVRAPEGRLSHYRIQVDMAKVKSGGWLVSRLQFVG
jgi:Mce-associated membrane protein